MSRLLGIMSRLQLTGFSRHTRRYSALPLVYSEDVRRAKADGTPIVALESTIITHGMPYPKNLETAREVEDIIRNQGATPATIAILKGVLTVGLTKEQLEYLAKAKGVIKASRRDLAPIMAGQQDGATTVAGTIIATELADIPVFVTGGIGGVHREGEHTMDVSADLTELGRCKTLVVCSGVKSILDIGRTLEFLETQGVTVCSFGESNDFPAFYTTSSGYHAPNRVTDALHAARILYAARQLRLSSGIVIAVPVPEKYAMDSKVIETAIQNALVEASKQGITGKEVTPFLLAAVSTATGGASLDANIALIKNNAKVGADIAVQFQKLRNVDNLENAFNIGVSKSPGKCTTNSSRRFHTSCAVGIKGEENMIKYNDLGGDVLVIGGANVDRTYRVTEESVQLDGSTHACKTEQCGGGVGRNIAEALWRLRGGRTRLLTAIGDDADGQYIQNIAPGLILDDCIVKSARTAKYAAVFDAKGECRLGLGDMDIHNQITVELVNRHINDLKNAPLVVLDGNIPLTTMDYVLGICEEFQKPVFFEPTDRRKAIKPFHGKHSITYASPNLMELRAMANFMNPDINVMKTNELDEVVELSKVILKCVRVLIVTRGSKGAITIKRINNKLEPYVKELDVQVYPAKILNTVENVSGAGDCFASGFIHGILQNLQESQSISIGFETAKQALLIKETVPLKFNMSRLKNQK
ncbi:pseudouridine-metabolizing bifunctional protein C1861.05 [Maniola jurtina]|uniref:pseudouridine-metabolizing bifunctional protein C1861.05 n=1 Tax=Maniola jurtina TaxID=191418 RepID=UPI001E68AF24|nr:pseudouridine-metabolizing bifunctional protein C1861.05 [Maniola jurtina]